MSLSVLSLFSTMFWPVSHQVETNNWLKHNRSKISFNLGYLVVCTSSEELIKVRKGTSPAELG
jgi:hypothetical protein